MGEASFVKIPRSGLFDALDLIREHRPAFLLLFYIAMRVRRTPTNIVNLGIREVKIGSNSLDAQLGLTEGEYRTAKKKLEQAGLAAFRATNWGTVAKLLSTGIFDPNFPDNDGLDDRPETEQERADNSQMTTNKNDKEEKKVVREQAPRSLPYEDQVKRELGLILADLKQLNQWEEAYPSIDIKQQIMMAQSWLLANPGKKKKYFKKFLVNWFARAMQSNNFGTPRPVSPQFALKMCLEYENNMKKLNDERDIIEASMATSDGLAAKKRLNENLQDVNRRILALKSSKMENLYEK